MTRDEAIVYHRAELEPSRRPGIRIVPDGPPGVSVFGGDRALLPPDISWPVLHAPSAEPPEHQGQLCLLAQIDFAKVRVAVPELAGELPSGGVLQIFSTRQVPYGDWDLPLGPWSNPRIFFWKPGTELVSKEGPGVPQMAVGLRFEPFDTFDFKAFSHLDEEAREVLEDPEGRHQILGHSLPIQDVLEAEADGKSLILALASQDDLEWYFHDCGTLYFHADAGAWREGRLEGLRFEAQSY